MAEVEKLISAKLAGVQVHGAVLNLAVLRRSILGVVLLNATSGEKSCGVRLNPVNTWRLTAVCGLTVLFDGHLGFPGALLAVSW